MTNCHVTTGTSGVESVALSGDASPVAQPSAAGDNPADGLTLDQADLQLAQIEARLADEVRQLVLALEQFSRRTQLIREEIPSDAKFCKLVTTFVSFGGLQLSVALEQSVKGGIFVGDGLAYLEKLGLSLNQFFRRIDLDGRRYLAVACIDQPASKVNSAVDAGREDVDVHQSS